MSLGSTSQYYVTVDSQFRDQEKYPIDTDFGVSFQTKNPNLNYPQGLSLDPSQPYPRISIDKNFDSIGVQVKGGKITEYIVDSVTGDIIFSGVTVIGDANITGTAKDFLILYNGNILFSLLRTIYHSSPFICRVSSTYIPKWLIMIKQKPTKTNTTLDSTFKLISNSSLYFMFDYTLSSGLNTSIREKDLIYFEKYTYSSFDNNINTNIATVKTLNYSFENYYTQYIENIVETKPVLGVFAFDINGESLQLNGHPWGYQQFAMNTYYYGQTFSMIPSNSNGRNVLTVDKGDNLYIGVNNNPFDISLKTISSSSRIPYYYSDLSLIKKPIFFSRTTNQTIDTATSFSTPTQTDNILTYYLARSDPNSQYNTGANMIGILKENLNIDYINSPESLTIDLLNVDNMSMGTFISNNSVLPVSLIGNTSYESFGAMYNTGAIYNISDYTYATFPSYPDNGSMTLDQTFMYTGTLTSVSTSNYTGTNVSIEYISVFSSFFDGGGTPNGILRQYKYVYTGAGNSSLNHLDSIPISYNSPISFYSDYNKSSKVTNWFEGNTLYIAYVLQADQVRTIGGNPNVNTIFIKIKADFLCF